VYATQASEAAEAGLARVVEEWVPEVHGTMAVYANNPANQASFGMSRVGASGSRQWNTPVVRRLNNELFLVESSGELRGAGGQVLATRRLYSLLRLAKPTVTVNAAVTVMNPIDLNGNAYDVTGINENPPGWTGCDPVSADNTDDVVGIRSASTTGVQNQDLDNVAGYPQGAVANDPQVTSATFQNFLDYTFATLASQPGVKALPSSTTYTGVGPVLDYTQTPATCKRSQLLNLGEPWRTGGAVPQCYSYYPVVHGTGSQTKFAAGSRGQGILLIDGDLEMVGGFEWAGLIIVRGSIKITGTGNKIYGALLAESVTDDNSIGGNVDITFSACAYQLAVGGSSRASPLGQRSWVQGS
jgi:hypothetical protein